MSINLSRKLRGCFFRGMDLVRLLLISALAATLIGCSSTSRQMCQNFEDAGRGLYQTHQERSPQMHTERRHGATIATKKKNARHRRYNNLAKIAESHIVPKMDASSFVRPDDNVTTPTTAKTETAPSSSQEIAPSSSQEIAPSSSQETTPSSPQLDDETVIKKAKATIAAKVSDPNSVEFEGMERAARKNALGNSIDTICGFVRDKNSGPRPFLYVVEKDEAYIGGYAIATSAYRNICSITTLPDR
jgi:hypothetical protein